ncbi:GNAT family N-acetyltransferase [Limosilactobacillus sp.]|jgi:phosphinothricin acetyltransferase|uniref:GNAT family N-acetyltransferase n=1 Tax=Limosilactobacillus sp. TaxID=2773925 RepID=UPI0025BE142A|nr:GNAT family N-acetyltransferase [Limosilactobacillus sp.]MCH3921909.1 GNAT family N-acetyltransferase [Limosilactobacillus sp.]MCH3928680.1 GNAT family N-acetyltransferase [Limosilactobacillus sp.]
MSEVSLRVARLTDAAAIRQIYSYYVQNTAITCEVTVPTVEEITGRMKKTLQHYPYLVAELDGQVVGFAYIGPANPREAYQWTVETSIYVDRECRGHRIGTRLYDALEELCRRMHFVNMTAHIVYPHDDQPDQYLTLASPKFHEYYGYKLAGRFDRNVYKFDKWYDMIWMEKSIADHTQAPTAPLDFADVADDFFAK